MASEIIDPRALALAAQFDECARIERQIAIDELREALDRLECGDTADAAERADEATKALRRSIYARSCARKARADP